MTPQSNLQQYSYGDSTLTISRKGETENTSLYLGEFVVGSIRARAPTSHAPTSVEHPLSPFLGWYKREVSLAWPDNQNT
ncbi:MAG: hypothetical protein KH037_07620 [Burkholderiales bacterium]|nr:hypothetical protein [Burkholderiales bacterium]